MKGLTSALSILCVTAQSLGAQAGIERLGWLVGCWEVSAGNRRVVERWSAPQRGEMIGSSRTFIGGVPRESEQLRLYVKADTFVYFAHPSGQQPTEFRAPTITDRELQFSNPAHDFPQRIIYQRVGADSLIARIEGDRAGRRSSVSFPFRRIECAPDSGAG